MEGLLPSQHSAEVWVPSPTRLIPEWVDNPGVKDEFLRELGNCGGARAQHLAEILKVHDALRVHVWTLGLDDFYLVIITSKDNELLRNLGEAHSFPRGYPIIWQPNQRLHLFGFYPKFKNDEMYKPAPTDGMERLLLSVKWSGFLFSILAFSHKKSYYWVVTSKNSGNCRDSGMADFTQIAADVITKELGLHLPKAIKELADSQTYLCGECMSIHDQGHGYGYLKDAVRVTCAGRYDNQYHPEQSNDFELLMHLPPEDMCEISEKCALPCVRNLVVPSHKAKLLLMEMEKTRDFLTARSLMRLLAKHGLPVDQFREHLEVVDSDTLEGLVMQYQYHNKMPLRVKWKLPRYTLVTMLVRPVCRGNMSGCQLLDFCTSTAKRWCRTPEGCEYYTMFGMLAGKMAQELPKEQLVAPWITAANVVFAMEAAEVIRCCRSLIAEVQESESMVLAKSGHVLGVQKHDSMGCAIVTLASADVCQALMASFSKIDLGQHVKADMKQHTDRVTQELCTNKVFLAWGRQQERRSPVSVENIIHALELCISGGQVVQDATVQTTIAEGEQTRHHRQCNGNQLRLVFSGLMGSGKSTLCNLLATALHGSCISQDDFIMKGREGRRCAFLEKVRQTANDAMVPVLVLDRVNSIRSQRQEIVESLNKANIVGQIVLIQMQHPNDKAGGSWENALQLCESRIISRGAAHPSRLGTRNNLQAILRETAKHMEPVQQDEASCFISRITIDMTASPTQSAIFVLQELDRLGLLQQFSAQSCIANLQVSSNTHLERAAKVEPSRKMQASSYLFNFSSSGTCHPASSRNSQASRKARLRVCSKLGAGLHLRPTRHGMVVDEIEGFPGQPSLQIGDCIASIEGRSLRGQQNCEHIFGECFRDGAQLVVEPHTQTICNLHGHVQTSSEILDWNRLQFDMKRFGEKHEVELKLSDDQSRAILSGPQSAIAAARSSASLLLEIHFAPATSNRQRPPHCLLRDG